MKMKKLKWRKRIALLLAVCVGSLAMMAGCGSNTAPEGAASAAVESQADAQGGQDAGDGQNVDGGQTGDAAPSAGDEPAGGESTATAGAAPEIAGLVFQEQMQNDYAEQFTVYKYEDGYAVFDIKDEGQFLLVPEGKEEPANLSEGLIVLHAPKHIYLAATALMALFTSMDALDTVSMTSLQESGWTFDAPKQALADGSIKFAGKYSEPDYEMLLAEDCDLAIESTMIYHTPEVQEMIEELGIPVLIDKSSYEGNPLGRAEWIRLYGVMTGHEAEADAFFAKQKEIISGLDDFENTELQVAFFYISTDGRAMIRASTDYIPTMIEMAGGRYIFKDVTDESGRSTIPMSIETFYDIAENADILIYNSSIDSSVKTMNDLLEKDPILKDMKAVKEGNCWYTGSAMYQRTDIAANMIMDFNHLFTGETDKLEYLTKLE